MVGIHRRTNLLWGLVALGVGLVLMLRALELIPDGLYDLAERAWPFLLVLAGLSVVLRDRVRFGSMFALVLSAGLVIGISALAFSTRSGELRDDYQELIEQPIAESINQLAVNVSTLATDVELVRTTGETRTIAGRFTGSSESLIHLDYREEADGRASFVLREEQSNAFPRLDAIGRGTLLLELPVGLATEVAFDGTEGTASFNLLGLSLERLGIDLQQGDALVTLPAYRPLSPNVQENPGHLIVREGNITIFVPEQVGARLELNRQGSGIDPQYPDDTYNYLRDDVLEFRNYDSAEIQIIYEITAPRGQIRLQIEGG